MQSLPSVIWLLLGIVLVNGEPEPMARPTRPKVFTSPEELRSYLDLLKGYYSLNGKARYGKRAETSPTEDRPSRIDVLRRLQERRPAREDLVDFGIPEDRMRDYEAMLQSRKLLANFCEELRTSDTQ